MSLTRLAPLSLALSATFVISAGCGDGLRRAEVSGTILVDKKPLATGAIDFFPSDGPQVGAEIKDGKYSIPADKGVIVGSNRVEIRGFRKSGRKVPDVWEKGKMNDEMVFAVPAEYNAKTTLVREVQAGKNTFDFDLPGIKE